MKKWKEFENFITHLESLLNKNPSASIKKNTYLNTSNGSRRQIDILLTHNIDRHEFKTVIECKDWKRKVDVDVIESFASKLNAVGAQRGIIVSKTGFTSGSIKESKSYKNITLYRIEEIDELKDKILENINIGYYHIEYKSNDWTVKFLDKETINTQMRLYTGLKFKDEDQPFDITNIAQDYLSENQDHIIQTILNEQHENLEQISTKLILKINFDHLPYFEINNIKTYVTGFSSILNIILSINKLDTKSVYKYQNLSEDKTVAIIINLTLDEKAKKLFET
jgi:hypothetical protein